MSGSSGLLIALTAAVIGPLATFYMATRQLSGRINTSEAASLWQESASIREDYRQRIAEAEKRQAHLEERVAKLETANNTLQAENLELARKNFELDAQIQALIKDNEGLTKRLIRLGEDAY